MGVLSARTSGKNGVRPSPTGLVEVLVYLLLAVSAISPAFGVADGVPGDGVDLYGTLWFFWWIQEAVTSLGDPSYTDLFFHPYGKDIFAHTGNNFVDAALSVPLQWAFGSPGYYKFWIVLVLVGNAWSFRALANYILDSRWAVFGATALWEMNPYTMFELTCGRPTQAFLWFLPIAFLGLLRCGESWRWAVIGGCATALLGWSYWFYAYFFCIAAIWMVAVEVVGRTRVQAVSNSSVRRYAAGVAVAAVVALVLVAPAVVQMGLKWSHGDVPGMTEVGTGWFSMPTALSNSVSANLHGYFLTEEMGARFFHHPVWGIGALAWLLVGRGRLRWGGIAIVGLLLATGPAAEVFGETRTMYHYLPLYNGLPMFKRLWFPYRAVAISFLAVSLGFGFLLMRLQERAGPRHWPIPLVLCVSLTGTLATERMDYTWPLVVRQATTPEVYDWMASEGGGIIDLPRGITQVSIVHQTSHELPLFGGMGENASIFWPDGFRERLQHPFVKALTQATRHPERALKLTPFPRKDALVSQGFQWVVLHRHLIDSEFNRFGARRSQEQKERAPFEATKRVSELLGDPLAVEGPLVIWALGPVSPPPRHLLPNPASLSERIWERPEPLPYEARLHEMGRIP